MSKFRVSCENLSEAFGSSARLSDAAAEQLWDTRELDSLPTDSLPDKADDCLSAQNFIVKTRDSNRRDTQNVPQRTLSASDAHVGPDLKGAPLARLKVRT